MRTVRSHFDTQNDAPLASRTFILGDPTKLPVHKAEFVKRLTFLFFALSTVFLFSGCGQSGALYLPGDPSTMAVEPESASPNESENDQDSGESPDANE